MMDDLKSIFMISRDRYFIVDGEGVPNIQHGAFRSFSEAKQWLLHDDYVEYLFNDDTYYIRIDKNYVNCCLINEYHL